LDRRRINRHERQRLPLFGVRYVSPDEHVLKTSQPDDVTRVRFGDSIASNLRMENRVIFDVIFVPLP